MSMNGRIPLPPECATREELWAWIEQWTPLIEEMNRRADESDRIKRELKLTAKESAVFRALYQRKGTTVPYDSIWDQAWGDVEVSSSSLNVYLSRIREKLAGTGFSIENVWGQGYVLHVPASCEEGIMQRNTT